MSAREIGENHKGIRKDRGEWKTNKRYAQRWWKCYGTNVDRIHYEKVGNGLEMVTVVEKFHGAAETQTKIDVTADSSAAMINAIINKLSN